MEIFRFQRYQCPFTVADVDIDIFEAVNDQPGQTVVDEFLITLVPNISILERELGNACLERVDFRMELVEQVEQDVEQVSDIGKAYLMPASGKFGR